MSPIAARVCDEAQSVKTSFIFQVWMFEVLSSNSFFFFLLSENSQGLSLLNTFHPKEMIQPSVVHGLPALIQVLSDLLF